MNGVCNLVVLIILSASCMVTVSSFPENSRLEGTYKCIFVFTLHAVVMCTVIHF